jgi:hypothetical protein
MGSCGWFPLPRAEIVSWVEEHRDTLPTTLPELSAYPVAFRTVIVNSVSVDQRTRFWEAHLRSFLEPQAGLTSQQCAFIADTIPLLSDIFGRSAPEAQAKMRPLEERMSHLLSRAQCAVIFGMVGPPEPPEGLPLPPGTRLTPVK